MKSSDEENNEIRTHVVFLAFGFLFFRLVMRKWLEGLWLQGPPLFYSLLPYLISY